MKNNKDYGWVLILFILLVAVLASSCSSTSHYHRPCKPLNKALADQSQQQRQFEIVDNQIIMFENIQ